MDIKIKRKVKQQIIYNTNNFYSSMSKVQIQQGTLNLQQIQNILEELDYQEIDNNLEEIKNDVRFNEFYG